MLKERKRVPRLRDFDYQGHYAYSITCSTYQRRPYFKDKARVDIVVPELRKSGEQSDFGIYTYCFMPDHLHLLLSGTEGSNLAWFMKTFKQRTSFVCRKTFEDILWQRGYYERVLRKEDSLKNMALYILNNPVREGLVEDYSRYPFSGSLVVDIGELEG